TRSGRPYDCRICNPCACPPAPHGGAKAHRLKAGGFNLSMENKDPFYDRDLNNFRLLFERDAISVGVIITRSTELQEIFNDLGKGQSYGSSTTHWQKLMPRIHGGGSGGCPVIAFGITKGLYIED
ncbi:BglII/BstYI family type II restriction endonuclease, partial [Pseudomonas aeruginosa]|uniref:BglII/BstYI family type II restriction endonuclease n=1 Tax=Pseudomonas aeruginosa TaxID=287 RepID=UPI0029535E2E